MASSPTLSVALLPGAEELLRVHARELPQRDDFCGAFCGSLALAAAGVADAQVAAAHEDGRLVLTVTGTDPDRVRDAVAGFALTVRCGPATAPQTTVT